jgi:DNA-directed RNA polymerase-4/5 subunit 7
MKGEIFAGSVEKILKLGVCIGSKKVSDYEYIGAENQKFMNEHLKLEKYTAVCFKVMGFRWMEKCISSIC